VHGDGLAALGQPAEERQRAAVVEARPDRYAIEENTRDEVPLT